MAAMKPRTGSGPMEAVEESRKIVMRIPSDGGGRLVVELTKEEAGELNFGAGYTLEVSTPGVDFPLTAARHWRRNRQRLVGFALVDAPDTTHVARIGAVSDDEESVALITTVKKEVQFQTQRLENITRAVVEIEFAQPSAQELEAAMQTFDFAEQNSATRED